MRFIYLYSVHSKKLIWKFWCFLSKVEFGRFFTCKWKLDVFTLKWNSGVLKTCMFRHWEFWHKCFVIYGNFRTNLRFYFSYIVNVNCTVSDSNCFCTLLHCTNIEIRMHCIFLQYTLYTVYCIYLQYTLSVW